VKGRGRQGDAAAVALAVEAKHTNKRRKKTNIGRPAMVVAYRRQASHSCSKQGLNCATFKLYTSSPLNIWWCGVGRSGGKKGGEEECGWAGGRGGQKRAGTRDSFKGARKNRKEGITEKQGQKKEDGTQTETIEQDMGTRSIQRQGATIRARAFGGFNFAVVAAAAADNCTTVEQQLQPHLALPLCNGFCVLGHTKEMVEQPIPGDGDSGETDNSAVAANNNSNDRYQ
jgi:hypothetical protein